MWKHIYVPEIIILYESKSVFLNCFDVAAHFKPRKVITRKNLDDISNRYINLIYKSFYAFKKVDFKIRTLGK